MAPLLLKVLLRSIPYNLPGSSAPLTQPSDPQSGDDVQTMPLSGVYVLVTTILGVLLLAAAAAFYVCHHGRKASGTRPKDCARTWRTFFKRSQQPLRKRNSDEEARDYLELAEVPSR